MYSDHDMLKYPCNEHTACCIKINVLHLISDHVICYLHNMIVIVLLCVHDYFHYAPANAGLVTNENNRRIIGMLGRIIGKFSRFVE